MALTIVTQSQAQLSLQQHLDIAPDILNCSEEELEGELQPLMMAQAVPNPPNDKKRVKVYELRNNDWFDRGTGFCTAAFIFVFPPCSCFMRSPYVAPIRIISWRQVNKQMADSNRVSRMKPPVRKNRACSCSQKISPIECCWRPGSARKMDSRSSKVEHPDLHSAEEADGQL